MKHLRIHNASYRYLAQSFREWLDVQGYSASTVYNLPHHICELLHYLESKGIGEIQQLKHDHIRSYYTYLQARSNQRRGGGLSKGHLNKQLQALRKFTEYVRSTGRLDLPPLELRNEAIDHRVTYLTQAEVDALFKATCQEVDQENQLSEQVQEALCARDRAMLAVYYGCGLRRAEGVSLDVGDIYFERSVLHVRKGKNYRERLVPINQTNLKYLSEYVHDHRPHLANGSHTRGEAHSALFLSYRGHRMQGQGMFIRLKKLQYLTGNHELMEKEVGLHTLRHSIATHLLQAGMKLESIGKFLGHVSVDSTQLYTHLTGTPIVSEGEILSAQSFAKVSGHVPIRRSGDQRGF